MKNIIKFKIKNGIKKGCLFGLFPIYIDIDGHYFFNFLGFRFNVKHSYKTPLKEIKTSGISHIQRKIKIVVSLTSFPARIKTLHITISTLLAQTLKPDKIILWLAEEQFPNKEEDLTKELLAFRNFGLEIKWCKDLKSYKKIVPALKEFPNDIIVTADDDLYYSETWLESLYNAYLENSENIYVKRATRLDIEHNKIKPLKRDKRFNKNFDKKSFYNMILSGSGCLFPPNSLYKDMLDEELFLRLLPTHDDVFTWAMLVMNDRKIEVVGGFSEDMLCVEDTQQFGLCKINKKLGAGVSTMRALEIIQEQYPQLLNKLIYDF